MTNDQLQQFMTLFAAHAWVALAALTLRVLLHFEAANPWTVAKLPKWAQFSVAIVLGQAAGALDAVVQGTAWSVALMSGALAAGMAILSMLYPQPPASSSGGGGAGGDPYRTLPATLPAPPPDPAPPPAPPGPRLAARTMLLPRLPRFGFGGQAVVRLAVAVAAALSVLVVALTEPACNLNPKTVHDIEEAALTVEQEACVIAQDELGTSEPALIAAACSIPEPAIQAIINLLSAKHQAAAQVAAAREAQAMREALELALAVRDAAAAVDAGPYRTAPRDAGDGGGR